MQVARGGHRTIGQNITIHLKNLVKLSFRGPIRHEGLRLQVVHLRATHRNGVNRPAFVLSLLACGDIELGETSRSKLDRIRTRIGMVMTLQDHIHLMSIEDGLPKLAKRFIVSSRRGRVDGVMAADDFPFWAWFR